jgi:hypothetical protein
MSGYIGYGFTPSYSSPSYNATFIPANQPSYGGVTLPSGSAGQSASLPQSGYGVNINLGSFLNNAFGFGAGNSGGNSGFSNGFSGIGLVQQQSQAMSFMNTSNQTDQAFLTNVGNQAIRLVQPVVLNTNAVLGNVAQQAAAGLVTAANTAASNTGGSGGLLGGIFGGLL